MFCVTIDHPIGGFSKIILAEWINLDFKNKLILNLLCITLELESLKPVFLPN